MEQAVFVPRLVATRSSPSDSFILTGTLTHHPLFVIGSLYQSTSGINEYSLRYSDE